MKINGKDGYLALLKGERGEAFKYEDFTPEQLESLKGEKGDKGDTGDTGLQGIQGKKGDPNTLSIGTVTHGTTAQATITGEAPNQVLNLVLPRGEKGDRGEQGVQGEAGGLVLYSENYKDLASLHTRLRALDKSKIFGIGFTPSSASQTTTSGTKVVIDSSGNVTSSINQSYTMLNKNYYYIFKLNHIFNNTYFYFNNANGEIQIRSNTMVYSGTQTRTNSSGIEFSGCENVNITSLITNDGIDLYYFV